MTQKPTGVFVRLPLTEAQVSACSDARAKAWIEQGKPTTTSTFEAALLAIGTPVVDGELAVITTLGTLRDPVPCVRQSEAQAQIAARDAEIVRLREHVERIDKLIMGSSDPVMMFCGIRANCTEALKGGAA